MNPFSCMVNYIHILHKLVSNPPPPPPQIHFFMQPPPPPPPLMEAPINLFYHSISLLINPLDPSIFLDEVL
jgi:hypothetical protein